MLPHHPHTPAPCLACARPPSPRLTSPLHSPLSLRLMRLERKFFSDWLQWLTSDRNQAAAKANFQRTMQLINSQMESSGVSH